MEDRLRAAPCFSVQVAELAVLRCDLGRINLGVVCQDVLPPLLLIDLLEMNVNRLLVLCGAIRRCESICPYRIPSVQVLSSTLISLQSSPAIMGSFPFRPTLSFFF